jgi:hypothetical protein
MGNAVSELKLRIDEHYAARCGAPVASVLATRAGASQGASSSSSSTKDSEHLSPSDGSLLSTPATSFALLQKDADVIYTEIVSRFQIPAPSSYLTVGTS